MNAWSYVLCMYKTPYL